MKQNILVGLIFVLFGLSNTAHAVLIGDNSGNLYDLDVDTNTSTLIGNGGVTMFDIAMDPISSILYGVSSSGGLYEIDDTTGSVSLIASTVGVNGLTFDNSGTLYGAGGQNLYTIDTGTGASSLVGSTGGYYSSGDIAFDDLGNLFMSATGGVGGDRLVSVDTSTGAGTLIGDIGSAAVYGLNYLDSVLYGFTLGGSTISIDTATGAGTFLASNSINANGADGVGGVAEVPEPSSIVLLCLGLLGLGLARRKA